MVEITNPTDQLTAWLNALEARVKALEGKSATLPAPTPVEPCGLISNQSVQLLAENNDTH